MSGFFPEDQWDYSQENIDECFATLVTGDSEKELLKKKITEMDGELSFALACVEASYEDTKYYQSESESRLQSYLAQIEANRVSLAKLSQAEKQRDEFLDALCKLCYAAETSGGTAGKDDYLCAAIKSAKDTIATGIINNIFLRQELKNKSQSCGECHLKSNEICDICGVKEE